MTPLPAENGPLSLRTMHAGRIARRFHEVYEELAPSYQYETREESREAWDEVPDANKWLMVATVRRLLDEGEIRG